ncbi:hypothetical protein OC842_007103 [Tilletia horrida]|uniref:Uncharacterized protein n=1 Tax=Tilletia horrida TaxID=155126 RepID=A0AAN6G4B8_9BASI|nr:hypothetical protein OC842_007103 [Tilletia horrida]
MSSPAAPADSVATSTGVIQPAQNSGSSESSAAFTNSSQASAGSSQAGGDNELPVLSQETDQGTDLAVDAAPGQGAVEDNDVLEASGNDAQDAPAQPVVAEQDEGDISDASQVSGEFTWEDHVRYRYNRRGRFWAWSSMMGRWLPDTIALIPVFTYGPGASVTRYLTESDSEGSVVYVSGGPGMGIATSGSLAQAGGSSAVAGSAGAGSSAVASSSSVAAGPSFSGPSVAADAAQNESMGGIGGGDAPTGPVDDEVSDASTLTPLTTSDEDVP